MTGLGRRFVPLLFCLVGELRQRAREIGMDAVFAGGLEAVPQVVGDGRGIGLPALKYSHTRCTSRPRLRRAWQLVTVLVIETTKNRGRSKSQENE